MARLALELAPEPSVPARFLRTVPAWGALAGLMLLAQGPALLASRWSPATVALVHVFTLGVLGNAMFGSLLQFLPAAAGVRVRGGAGFARALHAALNLGTLALVAGLAWPLPLLRELGSGLLLLAFLMLAGAALPNLLRRVAGSLLHAGIALSLFGGLATAALGGLLVAALAGRVAIPLEDWTNLHAAIGLLAWVGALLASVGRVVMPMFQGTPAAPAGAQSALLAAVALGLPLAGGVLLASGDALALRALLALAAVAVALGGLWLQSRSRKPMSAALPRGWRLGFVALAASAAVAMATGDARLAGALAIGAALPLLVMAMLVEISAFLGWIALHRRCGRGVQLPGVHTLLPPPHRQRLLLGFAASALTLPAAVAWPSWPMAVAAGLALVFAHLLLALAQRHIARAVAAFAAAHPPGPPPPREPAHAT
ncbi:hypothetical protein K3217_23375 [bacterium BD-1]|nr:hypothetical protein [Ottowia caeni]